jgi:heat shock protein HslJ
MYHVKIITSKITTMSQLHFSRILMGGLLTTIILLLHSCQCDESALRANTWLLEKYGVGSAPTAVVNQQGRSVILLQFDRGSRFTGNDGCNQISGKYAVKSFCRMKIGDLEGTRVLCMDDAVSNQADEIRKILREVSMYDISDNKLTLRTPEGHILQYRRKQS